MGLNFAKAGDESLLEHIRAIDNIGADVTVVTYENRDNKGTVTRTVRIEWDTHNTDARVLG